MPRIIHTENLEKPPSHRASHTISSGGAGHQGGSAFSTTVLRIDSGGWEGAASERPAQPAGAAFASGASAAGLSSTVRHAEVAAEAKPPSYRPEDGAAASLSTPASSASASAATGSNGAAAAEAPPKAETAAEKLARLRAKQAARVGGAYLTGSVGGDYSSSSGAMPPAKGLQRYQQLVRGGK